MFKEFREFIARGNVMDLAVAVIIGGAFGTIVTSLTGDLIMPLVGLVAGNIDFSGHYIVLSGTVEPGATLEAARAAGANVLALGSFVSTVINFLILAVVIFLLVRFANKLTRKPEEAPAEAPAGPSEIDLLTEIRDALRK
jgi:large conductance mechanosensitive channel